MNNLIHLEIFNNIIMLTLNSPPANKMNRAFFEELKIITEKIKSIAKKEAVIISGKGRHYSSGAELDDLMADFQSSDYLEIFLKNSQVFNFYRQLNIPVISLIKGICLGSGLELALFSHFRLATKNCVLSLPEVGFQLIPGCGGIIRLAEILGYQKALQISLSADSFNAENSFKLGIIDKILPRETIENQAFSFAKTISLQYNKSKKQQYLLDFFN